MVGLDEYAVRMVDCSVDVPLRGVTVGLDRQDERIVGQGRKLRLRALNSVNFEMKRGERVGISGPNGSGKTTFLRLISGMLSPDSGTLHVRGEVRPLIAIGAGIVPALTGRKNTELRHALLQINRLSLTEYVTDVADFADLGDFFDLPVGTYSPGMMSRLQFAMSTTEPMAILVLDEWLGVADRDFHEKARQRLLSMVDGSECLLLASHDERLLREMTGRQIVLNRGRLVDS